ncbi:hypothetical protein [Flexithrix dorotheae]|uniref:hypothetical protein n=1 Tax=Flexithrix dorotheae TaxID=70993 RepID=UPI000377071B|nr:hypothetical protein [Flexithrix dorotheae]
MNKLHSSKFHEVLLDSSYSLIVSKWFATSIDMKDDDYRNEMLTLRDQIKEFRPEKMLSFCEDLKYLISPDIQEWVNNEIFDGKTKMQVAILMSEDLFSQVAIEQTFEGEKGFLFKTKFFTKYKVAEEWLGLSEGVSKKIKE